MFRPSTAPRWNRQTRTGWSDGTMEGWNVENAARARNSGSSPRLNRARPPDLTKRRREIIAFPSIIPSFHRLHVSLLLKVRPADRQANRERACLQGIGNIHELLENDDSRVGGHRAAKDALIDHVDE